MTFSKQLQWNKIYFLVYSAWFCRIDTLKKLIKNKYKHDERDSQEQVHQCGTCMFNEMYMCVSI